MALTGFNTNLRNIKPYKEKSSSSEPRLQILLACQVASIGLMPTCLTPRRKPLFYPGNTRAQPGNKVERQVFTSHCLLCLPLTPPPVPRLDTGVHFDNFCISKHCDLTAALLVNGFKPC